VFIYIYSGYTLQYIEIENKVFVYYIIYYIL